MTSGPPKQLPSKRRWPRRAATAITLVVLLLLFLPNIACWFASSAILARFTGDLNGKLTAKSLSASWWSGIKLSGVEIVDSEQRPVAAVHRIETSKSLLGIVTGNELGSISIYEPKLDLRLRPGGSNVQDLLAEYLAADSDPAGIPGLQIEILNAMVSIAHEDQPADQVELDGINATLDLLTSKAALEFITQGQIRGVPFRLEGQLDEGHNTVTATNGTISVESTGVPLELAQMVATWMESPVQLAGDIATNCRLSWTDGLDSVRLEGNLAGQQLQVRATSWPGNEALNFAELLGQGQLQIDHLSESPRISATGFQLECGWANVKLDGSIDSAGLTGISRGEIPVDDLQLNGSIDLAKLSAMTPRSIGLQPGIEIRSGILQFSAFNRQEADARRFLLTAEVPQLQAFDGNREFGLRQPVRLVAALKQTRDQLTIEQVRVESSAISVTGNGDARSAHFEATGDLDRFKADFNQIVDLSGWGLSGKFDGQLDWTPTSDSRLDPQQQTMTLSGRLNINDLDINLPGTIQLQEKQLTLQATAQGQLRFPDSYWSLDRPASVAGSIDSVEVFRTRLQTASLTATFGNDRASFELAEPTAEFSWQELGTQVYSGTVNVAGGLASWHRRLTPYLPAELDIPIEGQFVIAGPAVFGVQGLRLDQCNYRMQNLAADGFGLNVREPVVEGQIKLVVDLENQNCDIADLTWSGSAIAARAGNTRVHFGEPWNFTGQLAYQSNLQRLSQWVPSLSGSNWQYQGMASGQLSLNAAPNSVAETAPSAQPPSSEPVDGAAAEMSAAVEMSAAATNSAAAEGAEGRAVATTYSGSLSSKLQNFRIVESSQAGASEIWSEDQADLQVDFATLDFDTFSLPRLEIGSQAATARLHGSLAEFSNRWVTELQGQWTPNWQFVSQLATAMAEQPIHIQGNSTESIRIKGPLFPAADSNSTSTTAWFPPELAMQSQVGWQHASLAGLELEQAALPVRFEQGILYIPPADIAIAANQQGQGRASANQQAIGAENLPLGVARLDVAVDLRNAEPVLILQAGSQLKQVQLTQDICHGWLKYVAPLVADAARAQGTFTATFDGVTLPLYELSRGAGSGRVEIHAASIGSGPLAEQGLQTAQAIKQLVRGGDWAAVLASSAQLLGQPGSGQGAGSNLNGGSSGFDSNTWIVMPEQQIDFRWEQGRVLTQGTTFQIDDVLMQTRGSIGLDQSMELLASVPVQDDWIEGKSELEFLRGQSIQVPIRGTLTEPRLDRNVLRQLSQQFVRQGASNLIRNQLQDKLDDEIQKGLQKLFKRK